MKFSLFYEMQISEPTPEREQQLFRDCLEQAVFADTLGYDRIWAVEHHGLYEYAHSSAPEIFLSFVAAKTERIGIGHGVTLLPGRYNHPIRIAERIATLDILSNGRVAWGTGKSGTRVEQVAFEIDPSELHEQWLEALEMIPRMWSEPVFEHHGRFYDIAPIQVVPKPLQSPHPPVYAACSRPELAVDAGSRGLGALNLALYRDEELAARVRAYKDAVAAAVPATGMVTNAFCCNPTCLVLEDDRKAAQYGLRGSQFFLRSMMNYFRTESRPTGPVRAPRGMPTDAQLEGFLRTRNTPGSQLSTVIGDPACARESIQRFADAGVDELILVMQNGTVPHALIMESLQTFAEQVMPGFR